MSTGLTCIKLLQVYSRMCALQHFETCQVKAEIVSALPVSLQDLVDHESLHHWTFLVDCLYPNQGTPVFVVIDIFNKIVLILCKKTIIREEITRLFFLHMWKYFDLPRPLFLTGIDDFLGTSRGACVE